MKTDLPRTFHATAGLLALLALGACGDTAANPASDPSRYEVQTRDLQITVKEQAELQALRETVVRSEVEGQATIIFLIEEGRIVEKGEKLVELDASDLVDKRQNQAITVAKAEDGLTQAKKGQEILQKELLSKRQAAESNLVIARMELEKFLGRTRNSDSASRGKNGDMVKRLRDLIDPPAVADASVSGTRATGGPTSPDGAAAGGATGEATDAGAVIVQIDPRRYAPLVDKVGELLHLPPSASAEAAAADPLERDMGDMANKVLQQVDKIRLAMADLKYQEAYYGHSKNLAAKQFITPNDLAKDRIEFERRQSQVGLAWNDLDLLVNYELFKSRIKLIQDVDNAALELERVVASNSAEETRADSELRSRQAEYTLAKDRLDNLEKQIANAVVFAPTPGLVIYARQERDRRGSDAIREGISVRERQDLIILPDTTKMQAVVKVQEAVVAQVHTGQRAHVSIEAYPDRVFTGHVTRVAQQADSNSGWMTSDRKVYTTVVELDGDNLDGSLRSRMAAGVTILIDELRGVLAVPLNAVRRDRSVNYVWKQTAQGPQPVVVEVGRHNSEHVVVAKGLAAGDVVFLAVPPGSQPPNLPQPEVPMPTIEQPAGGTPANGGGDQTAGGPDSSGENRPRRGRNGGQNGDGGGNGAPGGNGNRRGMGGMFKPFAEMTPEELEEAKTGFATRYGRMLDRMRENGQEDAATAMASLIADVEKALTESRIEDAQAARDKIQAEMRKNMPQGGPGGGPGGDGNGGGRGGRGGRGRGN